MTTRHEVPPIRRIVLLAAAAALALTACADATDGAADEDVTPPTGTATDDATTPQPSEPAANEFVGGAATVTVGDRTYSFDLDSCFMTEDGIEARGASEAGEVLDVRFFIDDPGSNEVQITDSDGELVWDSPGGSTTAPEFEVDEDSGGFRMVGSFTGRDGGVEDGELSGAC